MMKESTPVHLIVRHLTGQASKEETETLFSWIAENPIPHQHEYDEYKLLLSQQITQDQFPLAKGLEKLNNRIDAAEHENSLKEKNMNWLKIAASVALVIMSGWVIYNVTRQKENGSSKIAYVEYTTTTAQRVTILLPDGSNVKLNSNSVLRFPEKFDGELREVYLTGEGFFEVQKDSLHPFIVYGGDVTTRVLGTSFNVRTDTNDLSVVVATGKVSVSLGEETTLLLSKEKATLHAGKFIKESADLFYELAWKENTLIIDDKRMEEAAKLLERWYNVSFSFKDEKVKNCFITGKYVNEPIQKVLEAIRFSTGIQYRQSGNRIELSGTGCN